VTEQESRSWREYAQQYFKNLQCEASDMVEVRVININDYYSVEEQRHQSEREIMEFCLYQACHADLILFNGHNSLNSLGTMGELTAAKLCHIPIVCFNEFDDTIYPWEQEYSWVTFDSQQHAMEWIYSHFIQNYN